MRAIKVLLVCLAFAFFASSAWADGTGTDPTILMGAGGGSEQTLAGDTAADPIFITDTPGTYDFYLDNPTIAADGEAFIEVVPTEGESIATFLAETWNCEYEPPTTTSCSFVSALQGLYSNASAQGYGYVSQCTSYSATGALVTVACPAIEVEFTGPFTVGEDVSITITPEPSSVLLLCFGLCIAFILAFKNGKMLRA
jgi:hypothetical protein